MWALGETFLGNIIEKGNEHLHVVLSDPYISDDGKVVVLTILSSYNGNSRTEEDSCIIESGEHPFVKHRSYLAFSECAEIPVELLDGKIQQQEIQKREPLSQELIVRALEGLSKTRFANRKYIKIAAKKLLEYL